MKILTIVAHPDDEILGCGATVAKLVKQGYKAYTLILGEGKTARDVCRDEVKRTAELQLLKDETQKANRIIRVKKVYFHNFPDNRFDSIPLLDIVKVIEKIKNQIKPDIIFTHYNDDLNIDHHIVYKSVLTATRPIPGESVREIYSFEILSSTEWNYPCRFSPDVFIDISNNLEDKLKALSKYKSELKEFLHPRSLEGVKLNAQYWGMRVGLKYAEVFKSVRVIK